MGPIVVTVFQQNFPPKHDMASLPGRRFPDWATRRRNRIARTPIPPNMVENYNLARIRPVTPPFQHEITVDYGQNTVQTFLLDDNLPPPEFRRQISTILRLMNDQEDRIKFMKGAVR